MMIIREETPADIPAVRRINDLAFGGLDEGATVDLLRQRGKHLLSLVAEQDGEIVGHILFTAMTIETPGGIVPAVGLAPMAVLPAHQRQGVGSALIRAGLQRLREDGHRVCFVLGHPTYYPKFGFERSDRYNLACTYEEAPPEAFMVLALVPGELDDLSGVAHYLPEWDGV